VSRLLRIALALAASLLTLAAGELVLRLAGYTYSPVQIGANITGDFREEHAFRDRHLTYDRVLIWRPKSGPFSPFNPQGFRGLPVTPDKPAGARRIIALGDSNTFGWDVDEGANWPAQLHALLAASHPGTEVINAGVWGYSSFQGERRFRELISLDPDIVLVSFGGNDAHQVTVPDAEYVRRHDGIDRLTRATRHSRLAQLVVAAWDRVQGATSAGGRLVPRVSLDDYTRHLRSIVAEGRARDTRIVLLTRPFIGASTDPASWKSHAPAYNDATRRVAQTEQTPVIDVYDAFKDRPDLFDDESHFGVEGHRAAAALIHAELARVLEPTNERHR
jgi:lysophospholipase L1-like esterase